VKKTKKMFKKAKWYWWLFLLLLVVSFWWGVKFWKERDSEPLGLLPCPVLEKYCRRGEVFEVGDRYAGVVYVLPKGTEVRALFDGEIKEEISMIETGGGVNKNKILVLDGGRYVVRYILPMDGEYREGHAEAGEVLGVSSTLLLEEKDYSLMIRVKEKKKRGIVSLKLLPEDFDGEINR